MCVCTPAQKNLSPLTKKLIVFIAKNNLPISLLNNVIFRDLLLELIVIGQKNPLANPSTLLTIESRPTNTKHLINLGAQIGIEAINVYQTYQFVGVCIDSGKVGSHNYLEMYIVNSNLSENPHLVRSIKDFGTNIEDYERALLDLNFELRRLHLVPVGYTGDNLRVQFAAFKTMNERFGTVAIPCGCHCLNLALTYARKNSEELDCMCGAVEVVAHTLNAKVIKKIFHLSCPLPVATRWVVLFDVALWIVQHVEDIIEFLQHPEMPNQAPLHPLLPAFVEVIFNYAPKLVILLLPIKLLMLSLEKNHTSVVDIYPLTKSASLLMARLMSQVPELLPLGNKILQNVDQRLTRSKAGLLEYTLFLCTSAGFKIYNLIDNPNVDQDSAMAEIYKTFYPMKTSPFDSSVGVALDLIKRKVFKEVSYDSLIQGLKQGLGALYPAEERIVVSLEQRNDVDEAYENEQPEVIGYPRPVPEDTEDFDDGLQEGPQRREDVNADDVSYPEDLLEADIIHDQPYTMFQVIDCFVSLATNYGYSSDEVRNAFCEFFASEDVAKLAQSNVSNFAFWNTLSKTKFKLIGDIMLIYSVIAASESVCERSFSQKRRYLTDESNRTGVPLAEGRNAFMDTPVGLIYQRLGLIFRA